MPVSHAEFTELFSAILRDNAKKSKETQASLFEQLLKRPDYEQYLDYVLRRIFNLEYPSVHAALYPPTTQELSRRAAVKAQVAREKKAKEDVEVAVIKATIVGNLMDMATAIGKPLRDCTGKECAQLGGFFTQIAVIVGPDNTVSTMMCEADLQEIARSSLMAGTAEATRRRNYRPEARM